MRNSMSEVREIARLKGVLSVNQFKSKADLIRVIQLADEQEPCFNSGKDCCRELCMWADDCSNPVHCNAAASSD